MKSVADSFQRFTRSHHLIRRNDRILVAVSGGPDSLALLKLLLLIRGKYNLTLWAGHLNHGLRIPDARRDEAHIRAFCARESVPFYAKKADPAALRRAGKGAGLEEAARKARYAYLLSLARKLGAAKLATAHTLDDQAETVLMRLLRGSGMRGLAAIPPARSEGGVRIIRPLLGVTKSDLADFLRRQNLTARRDATNADPAFLRNRVRRELIPLVEKKYNPRFRETLADLSHISAEFYGFLEREAERAFRRIARRSSKRVSIARKALARLHPALRKEIYFMAAEKVAGSRRQVAMSHAESVEGLLAASAGAEVHLPRRIVVRATQEHLVFSLR